MFLRARISLWSGGLDLELGNFMKLYEEMYYMFLI
jgi:hypothetical protein